MKASLSYVSVLLALSGLIGAAPAPSTTTTAAEADETFCIQVVQTGPPIVVSRVSWTSIPVPDLYRYPLGPRRLESAIDWQCW